MNKKHHLFNNYYYIYNQNGELIILKNNEIVDEITIYHKIKKLKEPILTTILITNRCNLDCKHCAFAGKKSKKEELSTKDWKNIILKLKELGITFITFTGGEPFIRDDMVELANFSIKNELICAIKTNGMLITDNLLKKLNNKVLLSISCDGNDNSLKYTRNIDLKKIIQIIKLIKKYKIKLNISYTVLPYNLNDIDYILKFCLDNNIKLHIDIGKPIGNATNINNWTINEEQIKYLLKRIKIARRYFYYKRNKKGHTLKLSDLEFFNSFFQSCEAGKAILHIDSNGDIYPCPTASALNKYKLSNILIEKDIKKFWNKNISLNNFRKLTLFKNFKNCKNCEINEYCNYKCAILSEYIHNKYNLCGATQPIKNLIRGYIKYYNKITLDFNF